MGIGVLFQVGQSKTQKESGKQFRKYFRKSSIMQGCDQDLYLCPPKGKP
jgi:hypothetical protein